MAETGHTYGSFARSKGSLDPLGVASIGVTGSLPLYGNGEGTAVTRREEPIPALSSALSHVVLTGLLLAVAFPVDRHPERIQPAPRISEGDATHRVTPSSPVRSAPAPASAPSTSSAPASEVAAGPPPEKEEWPEADIILAREQCMHLLSGTAAEVQYLEPVKKGSCGLPAPVRLKSIGTAPKVVFDPPVKVNCRMVAALGKWAKTTLQPQARERMKSEVVRVIGASGYACRNIYNRPDGRLSQHALANAIDVGAFGLANGRTVRVLKGWGLTARDLNARAKALAAAKAKAKAAQAKGKDAEKPDATESADDPKKKEAAARTEKPATQVKQASLTLPAPRGKTTSPTEGAPPPETAEPPKPTREALFLRAVHGGACNEFGTVLGPEANDPHRDHFHLDLTPRRGRGYCR